MHRDTLRSNAPVMACGVLTLLVVWPVVTHAVSVWQGDDALSFGFLVPPVVVACVWWRRQALRGAARDGANVGLLLAGLALLAYALSERLSARSPAAVAASVLIWSEVVYLWGWRAARVLAFPIGLLGYALALQPTLIAPLAFWLQQLTANGAAVTGHALGLPIVQEGLVLRGPTFAFVVAEACSGMNSLLALLALTALWVYVANAAPVSRVAVLGTVLPIVLVANIARVVLVLVVAATFDEDAALGFFHGASSMVLFGLALAGVIVAARVVGCRAPAAA